MKEPLRNPKLHAFFIGIISLVLISGNPATVYPDKEAPFAPVSLDAADSILTFLSLEEKIAQFFVLTDPSFEDLQGPSPGGVLLNDLNQVPAIQSSYIRPMLGIHQATAGLPYQLSSDVLGAVNDYQKIRSYGTYMAEWLKANEIDFMLGPSLNVLSNDETPESDRSFSSLPERVAETSQALTEGMQNAGLLTIAGSFPGTGTTTRGFEQSPPTIYAKRAAYEQRELVPFKALINQGLQSVMMANAFAPGLDSTLNAMASTSTLIHQYLRAKLGYNGLIWSDMSKLEIKPGLEQNPALQALLAGSDVIIIRKDLEAQINDVKAQLELGALTEEDIDRKCKRVIQSKLWTQRYKTPSTEIARKRRKLETKAFDAYVASVIGLSKDYAALPLRQLDTMKIAVLKMGQANANLPFLLERYSRGDVFHLSADSFDKDLAEFNSVSEDYNLLVIIAEEQEGLPRKRFGISEERSQTLTSLSFEHRSILIWNGKAKALQNLPLSERFISIVLGHESNEWSDDVAIQMVFGGRAFKGDWNKRLKKQLPELEAYQSQQIRLAYGYPEEVGIASEDLEVMKETARKGIEEMAYPGCQVWFTKDSIVVFNENFGYHTYRAERAVKPSDLYDLASITKIVGSVAGLMKLTEEEKFNLDYRLCDYLSDWVDTTDYMQLTMREILAHQAGLTPWIPFYTKTLSKGVPRYDVYSLAQSEKYPLQVARELYIRDDYPEQMFREILNTDLSNEKKYKYSDVGYYFAQRIIERLTEMPMEQYLDSIYYSRLGLATIGYHPLARFDKKRITPTEYDRTFRNQLVHGYVHDPGAAMMGGVGGHAGLFSNANDLGVMMQMYLNGGSYGGHQFFKSETIEDFTRCQFCENDNRRGAGFDKPLTDGSGGPSCGCTSLDAFGHQGFTGTVTWADPQEDVVYVFLSNRVYPKANNRKLLELNIRTDIQKQFYQAIEKGKELASE